MHWADEVAAQLIAKNPGKDSFVLAAGISPSGTVHIGNFRDVATIYFVGKALNNLGKKTKLLFSWDEYDRFRKVPGNLPKDKIKEYEEYIGRPYSEVPDPYGCHSSYAEHYEKEFEASLIDIGLEFDIIRYQSAEYTSGRYKDGIIKALQKRKEIFDILQEFRTQEATEEEREGYYPLSIYCDNCGKDNTTITGMSDDCTIIGYTCTCGHSADFDINKQSNCKLPWKADWPMRWMYEGVNFEPGGKDHASPMGSYSVSRVVSKKVFDYQEPLFQGYEFIGIKGLTGKMSGSSGLNINLAELLKIYPPEIIWWIFAKKAPTEAFDINLGSDVTRIYGEFDKTYDKYFDDRSSLDEKAVRVMELVLGDGKRKVNPPFNVMQTLYSISNGKIELVEEMFHKIGMDYKADDLKDRFNKVSYWLRKYSPESIIELRKTPDFDYYNTLSDEVKGWVAAFCDLIKIKMDTETLTSKLYDIPKKPELDEKSNKNNQLLFFKTMYWLLIGKEKGPMLATLILALGAENISPIIEPLVVNNK